ncbi:MAG: hypothetical protein GXX94_07755 [Chloroflexi bacterium]|nr:hypothetical protein [Chloroflexota bacterium]
MDSQAQFRQAERQFRQYTSEAEAGRLDLESYRAAINSLRVTDEQGHLWMLQEGSGLWHLWLGDRWVAATPYDNPPPVTPAQSIATTPQRAASPARMTVSPEASGNIVDRAGCLRQMIKYALITVIIFGLIGGALFLFVEDFPPEGLLGVGLAALISLLISARQLSTHWEGVIVEIRVERQRVTDDDDNVSYTYVPFAHIREPSGKIRKQRSVTGWEVGDYVRKRQGVTSAENLGH